MKFTKFLAVLALAVAMISLASAQFYTFGDWSQVPTSVSNGGLVAGYDMLQGQYMTWSSDSGFNSIGGQAPGNGHGGWPSITPDGTKIGGTSMNGASGKSEVSIYDVFGGTWTLLGSLGSSSGDGASAGFAISSDGTTVVGNGWVDEGHAHALRSQLGVMTDLGSAFSGHSSRADAVSNDGSLIGGYQEYEDGYWGGTVWLNGAQMLMQTGLGDPLGMVHSISGDGKYAYGQGGYYGGYSAYRWSQVNGVETLDNPFAGDEYGMTPLSANSDGSIVLGYAEHQWDFWQPRRGWIWTEATGTQSMESFAVNAGDYHGEMLTNPLGISANGEWIIGQGYDAEGINSINWAIHTPVPEPTTLAALSFGAAALIRRRRK